MRLSLKQLTAHPPKGTRDVNLPCCVIGVLNQMRGRMSMAGLEDLAASIQEIGQHTPGLVVALNPEEAVEYLGHVNEMWGAKHSLTEFEPVMFEEEERKFYLFLIAGHRRLRAVKSAGLESFYVRLHFGRTFSEALLMQYHENIHEQVPPDNEARFVTLLWRKAKRERVELTLAQFARGLGKKPEAVRRFVRYTALPVSVQELVLPSAEYKKGIAFALLCELGRLQEARVAEGRGFSEQELMHLAYVLITQYRTAKAAAAWVSDQIRVLHGQGAMFELSIVDALDGARRTVSTRLEQAVRVGYEHLRAVARFHDDVPQIPKVVSGAAVSAVERTLELAKDTAPKIIKGIRGGRGASKVREALQQTTED